MTSATPYVIVGSEARKLGKTSLICQIISSSPALQWTAVKMTAEPHLAPSDSWVIREELQPGPSDSGRYLEAGAARSFFVQADRARLRVAVKVIQSRISEAGPMVIESTSSFLEFDDALKLLFLAPTKGGRKELATSYRQRADAFLLGPGVAAPDDRFAFKIEAPGHFPPGLTEYVLRHAQKVRTG